MSPASTSPEPAVASQGGAEALIATPAVRCGDDRVGAFQQHRRTGTRGGSTHGGYPIRAGVAECAGEFAGMRRENGGAAQCVRLAGKGGEHIGVSHHAAPSRQQHRQHGARRIRPQPRSAHPDVRDACPPAVRRAARR